jgi:hypothetical protein
MCGRHPVGKDFLACLAELVGSARVSGLFARREQTPMALMLSARPAPDQKHALEAPWDGWVLPISVVDRLLHDLPFALSNLVKRDRWARTISMILKKLRTA